MVDDEILEIAGDFNPRILGYITSIFEDDYYHMFSLWEIHKYKEVTEFINKVFVCDFHVIQPDEIIKCESLVKSLQMNTKTLSIKISENFIPE